MSHANSIKHSILVKKPRLGSAFIKKCLKTKISAPPVKALTCFFTLLISILLQLPDPIGVYRL
jgi:hypothetical protein